MHHLQLLTHLNLSPILHFDVLDAVGNLVIEVILLSSKQDGGNLQENRQDKFKVLSVAAF